MWRGEVLEGLPHDHSWGATVARLAELRLSVQEQRLRARIDLGRSGEAVAELRGLVTEHPLREELWAQLIVALRSASRTADAIEAYESAERVLRDELDAEPGARLRELRATLGTESLIALRLADVAPVRQLPLDLPDFTGRDAAIHNVVTLLRERAELGHARRDRAFGRPGVGKSAVAVRVAHAVRDEFPDGQLHVDLAGTSSSPRAPMGVLAELLRALGIPDAGLPRELAERSALLRSRLAGRRMCVVLDDAGSEAQVRPLLPGAGACAVLVTSRLRLPGLAGAKPVDVDLLPEDEGARLLEGIVGAERVAAEPESAAAILRQCGHLPLAIRVAGAKLTHRPGWTLRLLADRLRDEHRRLDELRVGDLAVRASVTLSYDLLPMSAATAFRGLGLLGPVQFPARVVAALLARPYADDVLDVLVDAHLVELIGSDLAPASRATGCTTCFACYAAELRAQGTSRRRPVTGHETGAGEGIRARGRGRGPDASIHFFGLYRSNDSPPSTGAPPGPGIWWRIRPRGSPPNGTPLSPPSHWRPSSASTRSRGVSRPRSRRTSTSAGTRTTGCTRTPSRWPPRAGPARSAGRRSSSATSGRSCCTRTSMPRRWWRSSSRSCCSTRSVTPRASPSH